MSRIRKSVGPRPYGMPDDWWQAVKDEHRTWSRIQGFCDRIAAIAGPVWHQGDGHGGAVLRLLAETCGDAGLLGSDDQWRMRASGGYNRLADRDGWWCHYCRCPLGWGNPLVKEPEIGHRIPKSRGGSNALDNLVLSCVRCNHRKGTMTDVEFFEFLATEAAS